jgi:hypothetical protein
LKGETIDIDDGLGRYYTICDQEAIACRQKRHPVRQALFIKHAEQRWKVSHAYVENLFKQKQLANTLSELSPIALYGAVTSALAGTDLISCQDFVRAAREYRQEVISHIRSKTDNFSLPCFFTPFDAVDTNIIERYNDPTTAAQEVQKWKELKRAQAKSLNLEDFPRFTWRPDVAKAIVRTIPGLSALVIVNVVLFVLSFVAFTKYDVR